MDGLWTGNGENGIDLKWERRNQLNSITAKLEEPLKPTGGSYLCVTAASLLVQMTLAFYKQKHTYIYTSIIDRRLFLTHINSITGVPD